ncbi:hypothetical protein ACR6C2_00585 [Streptomyces sp. INA 01156]
MTDQGAVVSSDGWQRLITARTAYTQAVSAHYDELLHHVAHRAQAEGSLGKADIGALLLWKRLRADTPWQASSWPSRMPTCGEQRQLPWPPCAIPPSAAAQQPGLAGPPWPNSRLHLRRRPGLRRSDRSRTRPHGRLRPPRPHRTALSRRHAHPFPRPVQPLHRRYRPPPGQCPDPARSWTPREMDTALYHLPLNSPTPPST